jgi:hypothetical protein
MVRNFLLSGAAGCRKRTPLKGLSLIIGFIAVLSISCADPQVLNVNSNGVTPPSGTISIAVTTAAGDFSSSNLEIISTDDYSVRANLIPRLHTDHFVRAFGADVYILERFGRDNVIRYDSRTMDMVYQENLGVGLNIHDIVVVSADKAYVSCYESGVLIIFNPSTGRQVSAIDMSRFVAFAGTDSAETHPYISSLARYGDYVYAACQRLKIGQTAWGPGPVPGDVSLIAVIDTRSDTIVGEIELVKKNPASMYILGGRMIVSSTGSWDDAATGGVEMIDLRSNENLGVVAEGALFGGGITNVVWVSAGKAYISVALSDWTTGIVPFNPETGDVGPRIEGIGDGFGGMAFDGEKLYIGDRDFGASGVAVVNTSTNTVERKISTAMPPSGLAIIRTN